jgi:hypothetical protein
MFILLKNRTQGGRIATTPAYRDPISEKRTCKSIWYEPLKNGDAAPKNVTKRRNFRGSAM